MPKLKGLIIPQNPRGVTSPFNNTAIIGFGTVGPGIALDFALKGLPVKVFDNKPEKFAQGMKILKTELDVLVDQNIITRKTKQETLDRITNMGALTKENLAGVDFVLEAIDEDLIAKQKLFGQLGNIVESNTIVATNTSALNVNTIAADFTDKSRVIGYHVTLPAHISTAVEIVKGKHTGEETSKKTDELAHFLGKDIVHVFGNPPGHIWNRLQCLVVSECLHMIEKGWVKPEEVQYALKGALAQRWSAVDIIEAVRLGNTNTHANYMSEVIPSLPSNAKRQQLVDKYLRNRAHPFEKPAQPVSAENNIAERDRSITYIELAQEANRRRMLKDSAERQ